MKHLKELKIKEYLWFFEEQVLSIAVPNGKEGSGLTIITWQNNTGKTAIFESFQKFISFTDKRFDETERHWDKKPQITLIFDDTSATSITNKDNWSQIEATGSEVSGFQIIQSRRHWGSEFGWNAAMGNFLNDTKNTWMRQSNGVALASILSTINLSQPETKKDINNILKRLIPNFSDWTVSTRWGSDYIKYETSDGVFHSTSLLWDGVMSAFRIAVHLTNKWHTEDVLLFDEPELSLHPWAQKELSFILSEYSKDRQIILATHSPYFINWKDFINGAVFAHLTKNDNVRCLITHLDHKKNYAKFIGTNYQEWQKPQILDTVAKELFFSNSVLLVEWQNDVGLIRNHLDSNNVLVSFDIFWYWVWSYSNMSLFLEMAKDLKIMKVVALYDKGIEEEKSFIKDKATYSWSEFLLIQSWKEDIRDKYTSCSGVAKCKPQLVKEWYFDEHWVLKSDQEEDFNKLMQEILNHFWS
jgi:hypothetical protein